MGKFTSASEGEASSRTNTKTFCWISCYLSLSEFLLLSIYSRDRKKKRGDIAKWKGTSFRSKILDTSGQNLEHWAV